MTVAAAVVLIAATHLVAVKFMTMAVAVEVAAISAAREISVIAVMRVKAIIHMAAPAATTVEPRACPDEDAVREPLWTVIAIGSAIVGGVIIIAVGADGRRSNVDAKVQRNSER